MTLWPERVPSRPIHPRGRLRASSAGAALVGLALAARAGSASSPDPGLAEPLYMENCASCHGLTRGGGEFGPPLSGGGFQSKWGRAGHDALRDYIRQNMPPSDPGSIDGARATALAAFLLGSSAGASASASSSQAARGAMPTVPESGTMIENEINTDAVSRETALAREAMLRRLSPVTDAMLAEPPEGDWLSFRRTLDGAGFSPLREIDAGNAPNLTAAWALALPNGTASTTPIAHDGILFVNSSGTVEAIDGASGDILWRFTRIAKVTPLGPPISQPRGMAIHGELLIVPTSDNHVLSLDMRSGRMVWDTVIAPAGGALRITAAPIVVPGLVIQGISGCAGSGDCFVTALDAATGRIVWKTRTIARAGTRDGATWAGLPDDQRFGGSVWSPASYDAATDLIYVGVSQTYYIAGLMKVAGRTPANSALYTDSTLAIDPSTGRIVWHYQHMDRDVWDMDWSFERILMTVPGRHGPRRVVATMGKLGILDILDAKTGAYISSFDMGMQQLVTRIDPKTGYKTTDAALEPELDRIKTICPSPTGVRNWPPLSFDASTQRLYVPFMRSCMSYVWKSGGGFDIAYGVRPPDGEDRRLGGLAAIDLAANAIVWKRQYRGPYLAAALATAGGVVFDGGRDRYFRASDARTGQPLWQFRLDQEPNSVPITYLAGGRQYVAIATGSGGPLEVTTRSLTPEVNVGGPGVRLWVFKLPERR